MPLIDIANPSKRFEEHLKIENNFRIIVSGEFGIGKTFFLNNFFDDRKEEYNKIVISPVNYVVGSNEDVFELIKADIVYNLFFNHIEIKKRKSKSTLEKIDLFVGEKPHHLFKFITSSFKKVNPFFEIADSFFESFKELKKEYDKYVSELEKDLKGNDEVLGEYLSTFWDAKGNLFEQDFITQTINQTLSELREKGNKNVLIIDDLDRMDPEHIFRVLNILSAHNNHLGQENKFLFDHVIIVCDIANIKKIYEHRYGVDVDFEGYIDKFYSSHIFEYLNTDALSLYVENNFGKGGGETLLIGYILKGLIENNLLTIRKLLKHRMNFSDELTILYEKNGIDHDIPIRVRSPHPLASANRYYFDTNDFVLLRFFKIMAFVYGSFNDFYDALVKLSGRVNVKYDYVECKDIILFLASQLHFASKNADGIFFHKEIDSRSNSGYKEVTFITYPRIVLFGTHFQLKLKWTPDNIYNAQLPYFVDYRIDELQKIEYSNQKSGKIIKGSEIVETVKQIIEFSQVNRYLLKAGIILRSNR